MSLECIECFVCTYVCVRTYVRMYSILRLSVFHLPQLYIYIYVRKEYSHAPSSHAPISYVGTQAGGVQVGLRT